MRPIHVFAGPRGLLTVMAIGLLTACHTYRAVDEPLPGTTVRVHVPVESPLASRNAPPASVSVEGLVVKGGDTLVLAVTTRREFGAFRELMQHDTVYLGPEQRTGVEVREFSAARSIVLGSVIAAGVAGLAATAFGLGGGGSPGDPGDPPPAPSVVVGSVVSAVLGALTGR
jgi:hypothetical protein